MPSLDETRRRFLTTNVSAINVESVARAPAA